MGWIGKFFGGHEAHEPLQSRLETLPGLGVVQIAYVVDCMGAMCPRPQLLTKKVLEQLSDGEIVEIVSDNPAAVEAFPWLAETLACSYLTTLRERDCWRIYLRKGLTT